MPKNTTPLYTSALSRQRSCPPSLCCIRLDRCRHSKMLGGAPRLSSHGTERIARLWNLPARSTTAHAVQALQDSTARPISAGGLAHYFVQETQRRAQLEESPPLAPASAIAALAALPASHQACGALEEGCPVCLQTEAGGDGTRTIMLPCGHKFHKTCESSTKVCANPAERLEEKDKFGCWGGVISLMPDVARRYRQLAGREEHLPVLSCARVGPGTLSLSRQNVAPQRISAQAP